MYKFLIPLFVLALLVGCTKSPAPVTNQTSSTPTVSSDAPMNNAAGSQPVGFDGKLLTGVHTVVVKTSMGDVTMNLDADKAPKAVTNFVVLSQMGFFNGLTFHRVIPNFMIQGGDPNGNGTGGGSIFGPTFPDEINDQKLVRGMIAMANRGPNTNGSQFFILTADAAPWLDGQHTVFGHVTAGMDIVDAISNVARDDHDMPNTPVTFSVEVKN